MAANTDERELYAPFATPESAVVDAALLVQPDQSVPQQPLRRVLEVLVESAENVSAPRTAWQALARAANLLDWHEGHEVANDLYERIRGGLSRSVQSGDPVFTVWGYDERTEAGRHFYVYHHAYDYLHDRSAPMPFRLACAMVESFHAWEADMQEMHPDVLAGHEVTPSWSPGPVNEDLMASEPLPKEAELDGEDLWILDDVASRWTTVSAARERLLTFRMATNHLHSNNARVPKDVIRRLMASAEAVGPRRPDR